MRRKNVIIGGSVILLAVLVIVQFRALILTPVWHWRHGDSVKIGSYQFPVARNWVPTYETGDSAMLVEVARKRGKNSWPTPTITLIVLRTQRPIDLGFWESVQQQVAKRNGSVIVDSRSFAFDGETLKCL